MLHLLRILAIKNNASTILDNINMVIDKGESYDKFGSLLSNVACFLKCLTSSVSQGLWMEQVGST